jgi:membrane-associated protease RseP (regulator of RpoE activity)
VTAGSSEGGGVHPPPEFFSSIAWAPERPKFQNRTWLHLLLFLLTVVSTTLVGALHYAGFLLDFQNRELPMTFAELVPHGFWYSGTILGILGAHELGHYLACRYYRVDASLPYFLPAPLPLTGTLGAFIRIREPIPTKAILFDIGAAGPFAGFLIAVPALLVGVTLSRMVPLPPDLGGALELGEPLLFQWTSRLLWGPTPEGYSLNLHPMAFAAWFGLLATALNLIPIGQLDGGHIAYAVLGRRSSLVTLGSVGVAVGLTFVSRSWVVWTTLMVVMLFLYGPHHPRTFDEHVPLDRPRRLLALLALIILIVCFTPSPVSEPMELIRTR